MEASNGEVVRVVHTETGLEMKDDSEDDSEDDNEYVSEVGSKDEDDEEEEEEDFEEEDQSLELVRPPRTPNPDDPISQKSEKE